MNTKNADAQPHPIDIHVGERVRMQRKLRKLSQSELADAIGITFQQVQKYERGRNRISASKLFETAKFLNVLVEDFFAGYEENNGALMGASKAEQNAKAFLKTAEGIVLAETFPRIKAHKQRRKVLELIRTLTDDEA